VARERSRAQQVDRSLEAIRELGASFGLSSQEVSVLQERVASELSYRPMRVLYVAPVRADADFFFQGSFRFNPDLIRRCVDAGRRAFDAARGDNPGFFDELDGQRRDPSRRQQSSGAGPDRGALAVGSRSVAERRPDSRQGGQVGPRSEFRGD
jgi:hypothetical protein